MSKSSRLRIYRQISQMRRDIFVVNLAACIYKIWKVQPVCLRTPYTHVAHCSRAVFHKWFKLGNLCLYSIRTCWHFPCQIYIHNSKGLNQKSLGLCIKIFYLSIVHCKYFVRGKNVNWRNMFVNSIISIYSTNILRIPSGFFAFISFYQPFYHVIY